MKKILGIIADDLTGANDSGVQLTEKGINTSVYFEIPKDTNDLDSGIVIDTNSRALIKEEAVSITKQASLFLKQAGYKYIYKKMDSTLRGHIGAELKALKDVFQPEFIIVAPAFPALGRTTINGIHFVNGEKITDTEFSKDPKHPVTQDSIPAILEQETCEKVGLLTKEDIASSFQNQINDFKANNITFIVCDAETLEDLKVVAEHVKSVSNNVIWSGSAGLAEVLPQALGIEQEMDTPDFRYSPQVMTVCGSLSGVTQNQVQYAIEQPNVSAVEVDTAQIFQEDWERHSGTYVKHCLTGLEEGKDIVLFVPSNLTIREEVKKIGKELSLTGNQIGEKISNALGKIVTAVTNKNEALSSLVLTGGDTAKDTSRNLGGIGFSLIKQVETGIPLGTLIGTTREFIVVTKAGAFGKENSIYNAMQELKGVAVK